MRLALRGPYNVYTGYGNDLVGLAIALDKAGVDVLPLPTSVTSGLPRQVTDLFTKNPNGRYDVFLEHVPPFDLRVPDATRVKSDLVIGWSMWEQSKLTSEHMRGFRQGRKPWKHLDMLLAYDPVSYEAFRGFDPKVELRILQGGLHTEPWQLVQRDWSGTFKFCMLGELHLRKDPFIAIDAFRELQEEGKIPDAELHLKTSVPGLHPALQELIPNLYVYCDMWSPQQVREFLYSNHVLLAPSRGEGKNLPALEMQLTGGVAVCTGWGGPQVWQHPDYSPILSYKLQELGYGSDSVQAAASKEHLKEIMVDLYENRAKTKRMGEIASENIRMMCDWSAVVERFLGYVKEAGDAAGS